MRALSSRRVGLTGLCAALAATVCACAAIDYALLARQVPDPPDFCPIYSAENIDQAESTDDCLNTDERNAVVAERLDKALELKAGFNDRLPFYSLAILAIGLGYLVARLRTLEPPERRRAFTDLGVAGVVWLLVVLVLFLVAGAAADIIEPSPSWPLAAGGVLVGVAAVGSIAHRRPNSARTESFSMLKPPPIAVVGAVLSGLAIVVSTAAALDRGSCEETRPDWLDSAFSVAFVLATVAAICGLVSLFQRYWLAALLLLGVGPFWVFLAALASACLS